MLNLGKPQTSFLQLGKPYGVIVGQGCQGRLACDIKCEWIESVSLLASPNLGFQFWPALNES